MTEYTIYTRDDAPEKSQPVLTKTKEEYGFVPNLMGLLAEAPAAVQGYAAVADAFAGSSLSPVEQQVVLLSASFENDCHYCMAAHSTVAGMVNMPEDVLKALRDGTEIESDAKLEVLRQTTQKVVEDRGWLDDEDIQSFFEAGYTQGQLLEVIVGVAQKTISNYTNHIAETPVDEQFAAQAWTPPKERDERAA